MKYVLLMGKSTFQAIRTRGILHKGGALPPGSIRNWGGKEYIKVAPGKWRRKLSGFRNKELSDAEKIMMQKYLSGEPIVNVKSGVIKADSGGTAIENARKWAELHTQNIIREDIGIVVFNGRGVKDSLSHGFGQRKLDAVQAVPEGIKSGKIVQIASDYDKRPQKNIIIMAPIQIGEEKSILGIRLVKNVGDDSRFYIHEVVDIPNTEKKGNTIRPPALDLTARPQGGIALYKNILQDIFNVKG
jgi:hypothetical protein